MPEVEEVFRMATQKVRRDPGAMERQIARQRKAARNRRLGAFATVAVLMAVVITAVALMRGGTDKVPASPSPSTSILPGTAYGSMVDLNTGEITPLPPSIATSGTYYAVSPDHTQIAYNACCTQPGPVMVANLDGTGIHPLTAPGWDAYGAQWSPDGSKLVYQQRHASTYKLGNLFVLDVRTGQRTQLTNFDQSQPWDWWFTFPSFSSDGKWILFQLPRGDNANPIWDLRTVPVTGGQQNLIRPNVGWGGFSPDGKWLAYLSPVDAQSFTGGELRILTCDRCRPYALQGGSAQALVRHGHIEWPRWSPDGARISYSDGGSIYVADVATGSATKVAEGSHAEWFDDHTLIVGNPTN
jgi:Tol biopolymer transport system component